MDLKLLLTINLDFSQEQKKILKFPRHAPQKPKLEYNLIQTQRVLPEIFKIDTFQDDLISYINDLEYISMDLQINRIIYSYDNGIMIHVSKHNDFLEKVNLFVHQYTNESIIYNRDYVGQSGGGILSLFLNISEKIEMMYISIQGKLLDNYVKNNQLISWTDIPLHEETKVPISKLICYIFNGSAKNENIIERKVLWSAQKRNKILKNSIKKFIKLFKVI